MAPVNASHLIARGKIHKACTPISEKMAFCKTDVIGLAIIAFTVFFLLFCLERIVKSVRKVTSRNRSYRQEAPLQAQSVAPLISESSTLKDLPEGTGHMLPLRRCLERSESESSYASDKHTRPSFHSASSGSSLLASVFISRPQLVHTRTDDIQRVIPGLITGPVHILDDDRVSASKRTTSASLTSM